LDIKYKKQYLGSSNAIGQTINSAPLPSTLKKDKNTDSPVSKQTYNNNLKDLYKDDLDR